jgi:hypothetical protein
MQDLGSEGGSVRGTFAFRNLTHGQVRRSMELFTRELMLAPAAVRRGGVRVLRGCSSLSARGKAAVD